MKKIKISKDISYLSSTLSSLPLNCIFDKGKVGCGGTSVAIESNLPYIICVPFTSLCDNKVQQYPNDRYNGEVYAFNGDNNKKKDLKLYLDRVEIPKIIVTYDSLGKLCKWITPEDYYILIDELHLLFTEYSYRNEAVQGVLDNYKKFKAFTFMTATQLEKEFILDELSDVDIVEAEWDNTKIVTIESVKVIGKVKDSVAQIIFEFLNNKVEGNAYFFVNSVKYIKELVEACNLTDNNCRAIYSKNNRTDVGIKRGSTLDLPKKINFITSTAFEGSDIYDENGLTFIISDSSETHTLIDISTKFQQIAGRIRNSKYASKIYHIFKETRYSELSYLEMTTLVNNTIEETKEFIFNNSGKSYSKKVTAQNLYFIKKGDIFTFDPNMVKVDLYNFKICRSTYSLRVNLLDEYSKHGYKIESFDHISKKIVETSVKTSGFEDIVKSVEKESLNQFNLNTPVKNSAIKKYPFLDKAIEKLGFDGIKEMKYNISNIKSYLIRNSDDDMEVKIYKLLKPRIEKYEFIPSSDLRLIFTEIYFELNLNKKAKGSDICKYYKCSNVKRRVDGILKDGYIINMNKIILDN